MKLEIFIRSFFLILFALVRKCVFLQRRAVADDVCTADFYSRVCIVVRHCSACVRKL